LIGVTGTPGTGKKTVSPLLASLLHKKLVDINSLARARWLPDKSGEIVVDLKVLRRELKDVDPDSLVSGHLLPELADPRRVEFVAVLRCNPTVLRERLIARGYPGGKVVDNLEAELVGVVLDAAVRRFGSAKVHEYDTSRAAPSSVARRIAKDYRAGSAQAGPWIDWTLLYDSSTKLTSLLSRPRTDPAST
jgi:adenylate kinase